MRVNHELGNYAQPHVAWEPVRRVGGEEAWLQEFVGACSKHLGFMAHGVGEWVSVSERVVNSDGAGVEFRELDPVGGMARLRGDGEEVLVGGGVEGGLRSRWGDGVGRSHWNDREL